MQDQSRQNVTLNWIIFIIIIVKIVIASCRLVVLQMVATNLYVRNKMWSFAIAWFHIASDRDRERVSVLHNKANEKNDEH